MSAEFQGRTANIPARPSQARKWLVRFAGLAALAAAVTTAQVTPRPPETPAPTGDVLQFLDGSLVHGHLQGIQLTNGILWQHSAAKEPLQFRPSNVAWIRFESVESVTTERKALSYFRFRNGDEVYGRLLGADDEKVRLESWFGGVFEAPRTNVQTISLFEKGFSIVYEGPNGPDGWRMERQVKGWSYRDGSFIANGVGLLAKKFEPFQNSATIEFDLAWSGHFSMVLTFFTERTEQFDYSSSAYMMNISPGYINMQRIQAGAGSSVLGQIQAPAMLNKSRAHFEIRANREESTITLLQDGAVLQRWKDNNGFVARGGGILFFSQMEGPTVRLSNIRISAWEGRFEPEVAAPDETSEDTIYLANRDRVSGKVEQVRDGKLTVRAGQTALDIPLQRITQIHLAETNALPAPNEPWSVRALVRGGGVVSFRLDEWGEREVAGVNPNFGRIAFNPNSIRQLQFNLGPGMARNRTHGRQAMNKAVWTLLCCLALARVPAAESATNGAGRDTILFANTDFLYGQLEGIGETVRWRHPDSSAPLEFLPGAVSEIQFARRAAARMAGGFACRVRLSNGDEFEGALAEMGAETLKLETMFAGALEIPRKFIEHIRPLGEQKPPLFEGPDGMEGWTIGKVTSATDAGEWKYRNGAFYASQAASIARIVDLPDACRIEFDLAWKGTFHIAFALYTSYLHPVSLTAKESEPDFGGFYSLQLNAYSASLLPVKKGSPHNSLGQVNMPLLSQRNSSRIEILASKAKTNICLLIDGVMVKQWTDPEGFVGTGKGIRIVHQGVGSTRISNLVVREWDGLFEEPPTPLSERREDTARLRNGDRIAGAIQSIREGKALFEASGSPLTVPLDRVRLVEFVNPSGIPKAAETLSRAWFPDGGSITFALSEWTPQGAAGEAAALGKLKLNPQAFARLQLNIRRGEMPDGGRSVSAVARAVRGMVEYQDENNQWHVLRAGKAIEAGMTVRTGPESQLDLMFHSNGPAVRLMPDSLLTVTRLSSREEGTEMITDTVLELHQGQCMPGMVFLTPRSTFLIKTPDETINIKQGGRNITARPRL